MTTVVIISADTDPVGMVLSDYARSIAKEAGSGLVAHLHCASGGRVQRALNPGGEGVFFFLHGTKTPPGIVDHQGNVVIDGTTAHLLAGRVICGTCYSLDDLGDELASQGASVVGYAGEMNVPYDPAYASEMEPAALAAHRTLLSGGMAGMAASAAEQAYRTLARRWFAQPWLKSQVLAVAVAEANADAVGVKGNPSATL